MEIPIEFKDVANFGKDLEGSYICALNADNRTRVEQDFIDWYQANVA